MDVLEKGMLDFDLLGEILLMKSNRTMHQQTNKGRLMLLLWIHHQRRILLLRNCLGCDCDCEIVRAVDMILKGLTTS